MKEKKKRIDRQILESFERDDKLWNMKVGVIAIVVEILRIILKCIEIKLRELEIRVRIETIQTITLLRSAKILRNWFSLVGFQWYINLRRTVDFGKTHCHSGSSKRPSASVGVKKSQRRIIKIIINKVKDDNIKKNYILYHLRLNYYVKLLLNFLSLLTSGINYNYLEVGTGKCFIYLQSLKRVRCETHKFII